MRIIKYFSILAIIATISFLSCKKDSAKGPLTIENVSVKWVVQGTALSSFKSFEFNQSGNYIIQTFENNFYYDTYQISNGNTIVLNNFGSISLKSFGSDSFEFELTQTSNAGNKLVVSTIKASQMESTTKTEMLCRTWNLDSINGVETIGTEYERTILFSAAGTYFVNCFYPGMEGDGGLAEWQWSDSSETSICYSWFGDPTCDGTNNVVISSLTYTSLVINEEGYIYKLTPVNSNTKSAPVGKKSKVTAPHKFFGI